MPRIASLTSQALVGLGITRIIDLPPVGTDFTTRLNSAQSTGWVFSTATFDLFFDNSDFLVTTGQTIYISETQSVWFEEQNQTANKGAYQGLRTVTGHSAAGIQFVSDVVNDIWAGGTYNFLPTLRTGTGIGFVSVL